MLKELKLLNLEAESQHQSTAASIIESKRIHRKYGMSKLVCSHCRSAILNYDQDQCSNCGFSC